MILKQKAFQKLAQIMKLKKTKKKKQHPGIEPEFKKKLGVHGAEQFNADTTRPHCRRYQKSRGLTSV